MGHLPTTRPSRPDNAYYEHITIPAGQTFLWRRDDYPWRRCVWNYHPEFEIHLIRHSSGLAYVGDYIGHFEAGHLVLVGSNLPHNWVTPNIGDARLADRDIVMQFDADKVRRVAEFLPEMEQIGALFHRAACGIEFFGTTAQRAAGVIEEIGNCVGLAALSAFFGLLDVLSRAHEYRTLASDQFLTQFRPGSIDEAERLERSLHHIGQHFRQGVSLADLAELIGMSESAFSRFFKAKTGNTFSDHISMLRVWTACKLLTDTDMPVTDICYEAGFSNISNFNRMFLRQTNFKPSQYRVASRSRSLPNRLSTKLE